MVADAGAGAGTVQRILLSVDVEAVDELLTRVATQGGRVVGPPNDMPWGQRVAHIEDPDGNAVNLTQLI
jgi:predicted enzyme related to lactoylglutathione lyase